MIACHVRRHHVCMNKSCAAEPGSIMGLHRTAMKWLQLALRLLVLLWHCWQQRPWRQGERGALADEKSNDESLSKTGHDAELAMAMFGLVENDAMRM